MAQDEDVEVLWEDQKRINSFGRQTKRMHELQLDLKAVQEQYDNLEDSQQELMLVDDDEVMFKTGGVFVYISLELAEAKVEKDIEEVKEERDRIQKEIDDIKKELAELKVVLYHKFGSNINLEE